MEDKGHPESAIMTASDNPSATVLLEKLTALEQRFTELEKKHKPASELPLTDADGQESKTTHEKGPEVNEGTQINNEIEESSPHSRVKIIKKVIDRDTGEHIEVTETNSDGIKPDDKINHAFILRKMIPEKFAEDHAKSEIDITNPDLWALLKEHLGDYPYHMFRAGPLTLMSPYEPIVFAWDILQEAASKPTDNEQEKRARDDLGLLLTTISGDSSGDPKLVKYFKGRNISLAGKPEEKSDEKADGNTVQFENLWTLFPPGSLIYGKPFQNQDQLFVVNDNWRAWPQNDDRTWNLDAWTFDWTGEKFQRICLTLPFEKYEGQKAITGLLFYPFEFHPNRKGVLEDLLNRGKIFRSLCEAEEGARLFEYKGDSIFGQKGLNGLQNNDDASDLQSVNPYLEFMKMVGRRGQHGSTPDYVGASSVKSTYTESRVMVDPRSYFEYGPSIAKHGMIEPSAYDWNCGCDDCQNNDKLGQKCRTHFDDLQNTKNWTDEMYQLCPPRTLGYILANKQWAQLQVSNIRTIPIDDPVNAWQSRLQLADDETKKLLISLVRSHVSSPPKELMSRGEEGEDSTKLEVDDIVPGKGKGLVILLYGPPGVGKTSTAETIAVATRKPLFSISVADVGTKARHVEANLSRIFSLATKWQAILLIDEADVFLESRGRGAGASMDRNALVSVFLRVLEYYQGIMFLTTNQIAQFDVAIPSRIHVSIQYDSLKQPQMEKIFRGFLQPLNERGLIEDYEDVLEWLKEDVYQIGFDGRQIRNIITTALGLARADKRYGNGKVMLNKKHLKAVVNNSRFFKTEFIKQFERYITSQDKMIH